LPSNFQVLSFSFFFKLFLERLIAIPNQIGLQGFPQSLEELLKKDAVYSALALGSYHLYDFIDFIDFGPFLINKLEPESNIRVEGSSTLPFFSYPPFSEMFWAFF